MRERPHLWNVRDYHRYVNECRNRKLALLQLGVGHNTPVIIRYPFEQMTERFGDNHLVRVNTVWPEVPFEIADRATCIQENLGKVLGDLVSVYKQQEQGVCREG